MDKKIFNLVYGFAQKNKRLGSIFDFAAKASSILFFIIYVFTFLLLLLERSEKIFLYIVVPFIVLIASLSLRKLIKRPRPLNADEFDSFPSNHSASASAIALACLYVNIKLGTAVLILALLTGILRVLAGRHYITDVLSGFVISAVLSLLFCI